MERITIRPAWTFVSETGDKVDPVLFELLAAIHQHGKLTLAAKQVQLSYRYVWELLERWQRFFGAALVHKERGRGANLSVLGEKLLWAEQRSDANLFPQLENIASELNLEIGRALRQSQAVLQIHASHGYAVEKLPALMHRHGHATVDLQYMGSVAALASLSRSGCDLAGFHVPVGELAPTLWSHYTRWLSPKHHAIIRLVTRTQGLITVKGNPLRVGTIDDLVRAGVRFVNRQSGSGTRILFDALIERRGIDPRRIRGYESGEFTHAAVAAFVASGMADVGFGVEPAAQQFKLDFIPMVKERYMLACRQDSLGQDPIRELLELLRGPQYRTMIEPVPGYALDRPGTIEDVEAAMADSGKKSPARSSAHPTATSGKSSKGGRRRANAGAARDD